MKKNIFLPSLLTATLAFLVTPGFALAGSAWSTVEVEQWQTGSHGSSLVQGGQEFYSETKTSLFGGAEAYSDSWGSQSGKVRDGNGSSLEQLQKGSATSGLTWGSDAYSNDCEYDDPCHADMVNAEADTSGYVYQYQTAESDWLSKLKQEGSITQHSTVDGNKSKADGWAKQDLLVDAGQEQTIAGETHAEGSIFNPLHKVWNVEKGNKLIQTVRVAVDNWLVF